MDMPTPCLRCGEIVEFEDMVNHPNEFKTLVCEDCHDKIEDENNLGSETDSFGNVVEWHAEPDHGLIEFKSNGEEVAAWCYEDDPEIAFNNFMEIWNKAQELTRNEKLEAITAERDRLAAKLDCFTMIMKEIYDELDDAEEDPIPSSLWDLYSTTPDQCFADIRAKAVMKFAEVQRGAYLSGFVTAELTVYDVYQSARNHVKDNYGYDTPIWDGDDAADARNAIKKLRAQAISKFVSDTYDTGQLSFPDCQWLEQWRDEWLEEAAKDGE